MNFSMIRYIVGWILNFQAGFMLLPLIVSIFYREKEGLSFVIVMALCLVSGLMLIAKKPKNKVFFAREGFVTVALSWMVLSITGALPFIFSRSIPHVIDAIFETVSGFTTTGASILPEVESLSHCILFWRSFTHWIGGMGVLVFILMIVPMSGGYHMSLMKAESPGPSVSKFVPKVKTTAKILYGIYLTLTLIQFILLVCGRMPVFDALTTTFGTAGTGGFGIKNDSIAGYSPYLQTVTGIFMMLFGINFNVYFLLMSKKPKQAFKCEEVRWYLGIIAGSTAVITYYIASNYDSVLEAVRHAFFQVASIVTTTGYATADFDLWPIIPKTILVMLMFMGACAGSTGGGFKVSRILILLKTVGKELKSYLYPKNVKKIQMDGHSIERETIRSTNVFLVSYIMIFVLSVFLISFDGNSLVTNFTAVASAFNNIGPGLELVGPTQNFGLFSDGAKLVLIFDMLAGRLEIFPLLLLFLPETWRKF